MKLKIIVAIALAIFILFIAYTLVFGNIQAADINKYAYIPTNKKSTGQLTVQEVNNTSSSSSGDTTTSSNTNSNSNIVTTPSSNTNTQTTAMPRNRPITRAS